jgi:glycerophosphoryl diester phosphodiesterase
MTPAPAGQPPSRTAAPKVERIGHRGAPRDFPENSLAAFERAIELGADAVELDVHVTADGVTVVHHDSDVAAASPRGRTERAISAMTWQEVSRVELGLGALVPSLAQVLDAVGARAAVYVELKGKGTEAAAIAAIRTSRTRCAVHSFDHGAITRAAQLAPELRRGILFDEYPNDVEVAMQATSALDVWPQWELIDELLVDRVHTVGGRVIAWTVNTRSAAEHLVRLGVDGLCGDDVRLLPK